MIQTLTKMADTEFFFDAVVGFLTSPIWNVPVMTYIEQNSLVFDPDEEAVGTHHQEIHSQYKKMVETLLASFLKDVGISEEEFMKACCRNRGGSPQFSEVQKEIFEQVWAAEDFEVFKRLMVQKNIELQLQALRLIQQHFPNSLSPGPAAPPPTHPRSPTGNQSFAMDEDAIMAEVMRRSKEEYEAQQKSEKGTDKELEATLIKSQEAEQKSCTRHEASESTSTSTGTFDSDLDMSFEFLVGRLMEIASREQKEMKKAINSSISNNRDSKLETGTLLKDTKKSAVVKETKPHVVSKPSPSKPQASEAKTAPAATGAPGAPADNEPGKLPPVSSPASGSKTSIKATTAADAAASWISSAKEEASSAPTSVATKENETTREELKRREDYLKQQRDKLLAMKRQTREKQLTKFTEQQPKARPTSARTAHRVTAGERVESPTSTTPAEDQKKLAMRRALADALKREVIDKK